MSRTVLDVRDLRVQFPANGTPITVVRDVSFTVDAGECLAIVGESGSGKSVTSLGVLGLLPGKGEIAGGQVLFGGDDLVGLDAGALRRIRGEKIAMIFQDPSAALNPLFTVERQIGDVLRAHKDWSAQRRRERVLEVLEQVRFPDAARRMKSYPHELSGGLRQRVAIALALACGPELVIADEPTTNLDVSVQAQIVELLASLKRELEFSIVFITHDVALARHIADRVLVMYAGHAVEEGPTDEVLDRPAHPYTIGLLHSAPTGESHAQRRLTSIPGSIPDLRTVEVSAPFAGRCPVSVTGVCEHGKPDWSEAGPGHRVACHRFARDGREGTTWTR